MTFCWFCIIIFKMFLTRQIDKILIKMCLYEWPSIGRLLFFKTFWRHKLTLMKIWFKEWPSIDPLLLSLRLFDDTNWQDINENSAQGMAVCWSYTIIFKILFLTTQIVKLLMRKKRKKKRNERPLIGLVLLFWRYCYLEVLWVFRNRRSEMLLARFGWPWWYKLERLAGKG